LTTKLNLAAAKIQFLSKKQGLALFFFRRSETFFKNSASQTFRHFSGSFF